MNEKLFSWSRTLINLIGVFKFMFESVVFRNILKNRNETDNAEPCVVSDINLSAHYQVNLR